MKHELARKTSVKNGTWVHRADTKGLLSKPLSKAASLAMAVCILFGALAFGSGPAAAAGRTYTTVEELGINNWQHYNGILFGNWNAKQADIEGAMAVAGSVWLAESDAFSIVANGEEKVMGNYDPTLYPYPAAIMGFDTGRGDTLRFGPGGAVQSYGDIVMRDDNGARTAYASQAGSITYHKGGHATYTNSAVIDAFFAGAKTTTAKIVTGFADANNSAVDGSRLTGWNGVLKNANPSNFMTTLTGDNNESILVINVETSDNQVRLGEIQMDARFAEYDLVVFNFPTVRSVSFLADSNLWVGGVQVYTTSKSGAPYDRQVEWANRMLWLFPEANNIDINGSVVGSVVAPNATVLGLGGNINGMLIAQDLVQQNGFELHAFGMSPLVPKVIDPLPEPEPEPEYRRLQIAKLDEKVLGTADGGTAENTLHDVLPGAAFRLEIEHPKGSGHWVNYYGEYLKDINLLSYASFTNEDGLATLDKLEYGREYRLVETRAPEGYALPQNPDNPTYFTIHNNGEVETRDMYTNADGETLVIYEKLTDTLRVFNRQEMIPLQVVKWDNTNDTPLGGAIFGLRNAETNEIINSALTSDSGTGEVLLPALPVGGYLLYEHTAPNGYEQPPVGNYYTITIADVGAETADLRVKMVDWDGNEVSNIGSDTYPVYEVYNQVAAAQPNRVEFIKYDFDSEVALGGAVFNVYKEVQDFTLLQGDEKEFTNDKSDGAPMRYWRLVAENQVSGSDPGNLGYIYVDDVDIEPTDAFLLEEVTAPLGYNKWDEPRIFDCKDLETNGKYVFRFFVSNIPNNTDFGSFRFAKVDDEGRPVYGASFMLFRKTGNVYTYTGRSVTLSDTNEFTSGNLPEGDYMLRESYLPDGYELADDEARNTYFNIRLDADGMTGAGTADNPYVGRDMGVDTPVQIQNTPWRTTFGIVKMDRATDELMGGVTFRLYRRDSIMEDWQVYSRDGNDGYYTTNEFGEAGTTLGEGMYMLEEIQTWDGYKITSPMYYTIDRETTPRAITLRIFNEKRVTGGVSVTKADALDTSKLLEGSQYTLYAAPDTEYRRLLDALRNGTRTLEDIVEDDNLWAPWPSEAASRLTIPDGGTLAIDGLESGLYKLVETNPPAGYTLWGGTWDAILFEMVYEGEPGNEPVVYLGEIFGNHMNTDTGVVFVNLAENDVPDVPGATITIKKVDHNDNSVALPGTTFSLMRYGGQDAGDMLEQLNNRPAEEAFALAAGIHTGWSAFPNAAANIYETGEGGVVDVSDLLPGIYRIEEIVPPPGYMLWGDTRDVIYVLVEEVLEARLGSRTIKATNVLGAHVVDGGQVIFADIPEPPATPHPDPNPDPTPKPDTNGPDDPYDPSVPRPAPVNPVVTAPGEDAGDRRETGSPETGDAATQAAIFYGLVAAAAVVMAMVLAGVKRHRRRKRERAVRIYWKARR